MMPSEFFKRVNSICQCGWSEFVKGNENKANA